jgi:hypothetical protein
MKSIIITDKNGNKLVVIKKAGEGIKSFVEPMLEILNIKVITNEGKILKWKSRK